MKHVDVAIIGAGSAGLRVARILAAENKEFVVINSGPYGTTCARIGCMPSKALIQAADDFHRRESFKEMGIHGAAALEVDTAEVMSFVRAKRDTFTGWVKSGTRSILEGKTIDGQARFIGPDLLEVDGEQIKAGSIVVATGSTPIVPTAWAGTLGDRLITSDDLFELERLPQRMAVIGLGTIGLELGQAVARLGTEVYGFEMTDRLGGLSDPEVLAKAKERFKKEMSLSFGVAASVERTQKGVRVCAGETIAEVDNVLASLGRKPNIEGLGLEALGLPLNKAGLPPIDPHSLQVEGLPVYFAGDVTGERTLLHESHDDGRVAAWNLLASEPQSWQRRVPLAIGFTQPNLAVVGTPFSALDTDRSLIGQTDFSHSGRSVILGENDGMLRLYADQSTGRLLGCEMVAPRGEHLAHQLAWAIQQQLTVQQVLELPFYHPVVEEAVKGVLESMVDQMKDPAGWRPLSRL